jgi:hypothetical protein
MYHFCEVFSTLETRKASIALNAGLNGKNSLYFGYIGTNLKDNENKFPISCSFSYGLIIKEL